MRRWRRFFAPHHAYGGGGIWHRRPSVGAGLLRDPKRTEYVGNPFIYNQISRRLDWPCSTCSSFNRSSAWRAAQETADLTHTERRRLAAMGGLFRCFFFGLTLNRRRPYDRFTGEFLP